MNERPTFGKDVDKPMDKEERRRESWRRSSRKYRATKKVEQIPAWKDDEERT
jgi:hypothetical protein